PEVDGLEEPSRVRFSAFRRVGPHHVTGVGVEGNGPVTFRVDFDNGAGSGNSRIGLGDEGYAVVAEHVEPGLAGPADLEYVDFVTAGKIEASQAERRLQFPRMPAVQERARERIAESAKRLGLSLHTPSARHHASAIR